MNGQFRFGDLSPIKYFSATALILGIMLAFVSPDDELPYGWLVHLIHWLFQTCVPMLLIVGLHITFHRSIYFAQQRYWIKLGLSGLIGAFIFSPFALLSDLVFADERLQYSFLEETMQEFIVIAPPITFFWVVINLPFQQGWRFQNKNDVDTEVSHTGDETPAFLQLLPIQSAQDIIFIKSELHYLKVVTTQQEDLILYSINKAIKELPFELGIQPHRSFWVNLNHIINIKKKGREGIMTLSEGSRIPVSRSRLKTSQQRWKSHNDIRQ